MVVMSAALMQWDGLDEKDIRYDIIQDADRYDLQIFVHTVNDKEAVRGLLEKGVGVYADRVE